MQIQVKARCVIRSGDLVLLEERADPRGGVIYRPPGGNVELGERSQDAIQRELQEECGVEVSDLRLLGVLEDIGSEQPPHHRIQFIYEGVVPQDFYQLTSVTVQEGDEVYTARWRSLEDETVTRLAPAGLLSLLQGRERAAG